MPTTPAYGNVTAASSGEGTLVPWESLAVEAVGNAIEFWGFKRNQGRLWALLYLRGEPMSSNELQEALGLSKGALSMLVRDLEGWGVVNRATRSATGAWCYEGNTSLMDMISRVLTRREIDFIRGVVADLERAEALAKKSGKIAPEVLERLASMRRLGGGVLEALEAFTKTAKLDIRGVVSALADRARAIRRKK